MLCVSAGYQVEVNGDFFQQDLLTGQWMALTSANGVGGLFPSARIGHAFVAMDRNLYLHGGLVKGTTGERR